MTANANPELFYISDGL